MITFLASPKAFQGAAKEHQYRAVQSWLAAGEGVEVILYGDSAGIDEAGNDLHVQVVKRVGCSPAGIPYFGAIVEHAAAHARHDLQVYLNSDILLTGLPAALKRLDFPRFLLVGQRIDLGEGQFVDVARPNWMADLQRLAREGKAILNDYTATDYFAFRRGTWQDLPPIIIGRGAYDQALLAYCLTHRVPIIDATFTVAALHQFHGYGHVPGGLLAVIRGEDARQNIRCAGGVHSTPNIGDATFALHGPTAPPLAINHDWMRRLEMTLRFPCRLGRLVLALRIPWRILRAMGLRPDTLPQLQDVLAELASLPAAPSDSAADRPPPS